MFITLCYAFLTYYLDWSRRCVDALLQEKVKLNMTTASIAFRTLHKVYSNLSKSNQYCSLTEHFAGDLSQQELLMEKMKQVVKIGPKMLVNLRKWTSYLASQSECQSAICRPSEQMFVLLEALKPEDEGDFLSRSLSISHSKRVKVVDYATPIAWRSGSPFGIILRCLPDNYCIMGRAFLDGCLVMDDVLEIHQLISVAVDGEPTHLLRTDRQSDYSLMTDDLSRSLLEKVPSLLEEQFASTSKISPMLNEKELGTHMQAGGDGPDISHKDIVNPIKDDRLDDTQNTIIQLTPNTAGSSNNPSADFKEDKITNLIKKRQHGKPPNILIYCGKKDSNRLFEDVKSAIELCVGRHCYAIYHLKHDQVLSQPWQDNTELLVIASEKLYDGIDILFKVYLEVGGKVLSFCSPLDKYYVLKQAMAKQGTCTAPSSVDMVKMDSGTNAAVISGGSWYNLSSVGANYSVLYQNCNNQPLVVKYCDSENHALAVFSQIHLEKDAKEMAINPEIFSLLKQSNTSRIMIIQNLLDHLQMEIATNDADLVLTPCYVYAWNKATQDSFFKCLSTRMTDNCLKSREVTLKFEKHSVDMQALANLLPVITDGDWGEVPFNLDTYCHCLNTQTMGKVVMYVDVIPSTMNIFDGMMFQISNDIGVICIAGQQSAGKGRGGNNWLSPQGCAMFSTLIKIPLGSELGRRPGFIQHIASLAVVQAVKTMKGYEDVDLKIKWPNDIYYSNVMKLGGVLVNSTVMKDSFYAVIGCGFNVSNSNPTICINDLVNQLNKRKNTNLAPCLTEQLIACTMTCLEQLVEVFQSDGYLGFCDIYYKHWLHSNQKITLESEGNVDVTVQGLDEHGYLSVITPLGNVLSVAPDGNTFDMMRNLIRLKTT